MCAPDRFQHLVIIIGAMKCGTTSLHSYVNAHPSIRMSRKKELDFFIEERNWKRGVKWYESHIPLGNPWAGEASPNYSKYPEFAGVPERMAAIAPKAKLIYLVRHPIKRAISSYIHGLARGWEHRPIDEALGNPENNIHVMPSCYYLQLSQYLPFFDLSNIFISSSERLKTDKLGLIKDVFKFLRIETELWDPAFGVMKNLSTGRTQPTRFTRQVMRLPGGKYVRQILKPFLEPKIGQPEISTKTHERLQDFLSQDISNFRNLTGMDFEEWQPDI